MPTLQEIVWQHGDAYLARYGDAMLPSHKRALAAIAHCRTGALGAHQYQCQQCGHIHPVYHACRHRMCPGCQHCAAEQWLERQTAQLLNVPYFHLVFTLPEQLRPLVAQNQQLMIHALFFAARQALFDLCKDPRYLGGRIGMLQVLHTWSRTLMFHPHLHVLVPGVAIDAEGQAIVSKPNFLVPVFALSDRFRNLFLKRVAKVLPDVALPEGIATLRFVTYSKTVPHGADHVLSYFARYVNKTAINNHRIVEVTERTVTFRYTDLRDKQRKTMTLPAVEFIRRLLAHTPKRGLHRVRHAGLLHPKATSQLIALRLAFPLPETPTAPQASVALQSEDTDDTFDRDALEITLAPCPHCQATTWKRIIDLLPRPPPPWDLLWKDSLQKGPR